MRRPIESEIITYCPANLTHWKREVEILAQRDRKYHLRFINFFSNTRAKLLLQIKAAEIYLHKLEYHPSEIVIPLYESVLKTVRDFENEYPADQTEMVREVINNIMFQLYFIHQDAHLQSNLAYQTIYMFICGLLWKSFRDLLAIPLPGNHDILAVKIWKELQQTHMNDQDNFLIGHSAREIYHSRAIQGIRSLYRPAEFSLFTQEKFNLQNTINYHSSPLISPASKTLAQLILDELADMEDINFSTELMKATTQLLKEPNSIPVRQNYLRLAEHAQGKPSLGRKLLGLALMVLNVSFIMLLAALHSPFVLLTLPFILISAQSDYKIFKSGLRHGLSKRLKLFGDSTQAHSEWLPFGTIIPVAEIVPTAPRAFRLG